MVTVSTVCGEGERRKRCKEVVGKCVRTAGGPGEADGDYYALDDDRLEGEPDEQVRQRGDVQGEDAVAQDAQALEEGTAAVCRWEGGRGRGDV